MTFLLLLSRYAVIAGFVAIGIALVAAARADRE
jgi:hypothetical protein